MSWHQVVISKNERNTKGVGVDFPGVSSTRSHGAVGAVRMAHPGPRLTNKD